ncbi:DUF4326 domain-containing protein [Nostoc sp. FACHB-110]|uniref:DUF4326 domain-containing protein n=1 Tax=Nostoc sp. FACHB-110 TaxID=2692834 RepID=UPI00168A169F|nr:DUF4326 domain-containing protein [Nostoc sp. FACHB-110]MBD2440602.1 DUF4326 domain-containing protein [Nostoc sp. FACHB-110]
MNILKYRDGYVSNPRLIYCGRPKNDEYLCQQLLIGLGNPFTWKPTKKAKFKVRNLAESLSKYRQWLWKLICCYKDRNLEQLQPWEFRYWQFMKCLAIAISNHQVDGLVCWCIEAKDYVPAKGLEKCHTQILYCACLYMIESGLVDVNCDIDINLNSLWE